MESRKGGSEMREWLQKKFALTEQGGKDLAKAVGVCTLTNIGLMFPVGIEIGRAHV